MANQKQPDGNLSDQKSDTKTKTSPEEKIKIFIKVTAGVCGFLVLAAIFFLVISFRKVPPQRITVHEPSRHLIAVAKGSDDVFLGWRLFSTDPYNDSDFGFTVWRSENLNSGYTCLNSCNEINDSTNYIDTTATGDKTHYYYVRSDEDKNSNVAQVSAVSDPITGIEKYRQINSPIEGRSDAGVGDLNGDQLLDYVIRDTNHVNEDILPDGDPPGDGELDCPDCTYIIRAYSHDGTELWEYDTGWYARQWDLDKMRWETNSPVPFVVWDMNGDGQAEVITRTDNGPGNDEDVHLTYLSIIKTEGNSPYTTSDTRAELPLPTQKALDLEARGTDPYNVHRVNFPNYLSVAYLDGENSTPNLVLQNSVHDGERLTAYNVDPETLELTQRWDFQSITGYNGNQKDPNEGTGGSGYHGVMVYDMDGDDKDEVFDGSTLLDGEDLNPDTGDESPEIIWTAKRDNDRRLWHPDVVIPGDILTGPDNEGLEVYYASEGHPTGVYVVDGDTGEVIWEYGVETGHRDDCWVADILDAPGYEGYELYNWNVDDTESEIFKEDSGDIVWNDNCAYKRENYMNAIQWDEDETVEVYRQYVQITNQNHQDYEACHDIPTSRKIENAIKNNDGTLGFDNGISFSDPGGGLRADVFGDYREEFFYTDNNKLTIYTNTDEINTRIPSRWENLEYRKDASRAASSYWRYYNPNDFSVELPSLTVSTTFDNSVVEDELNMEITVTNTGNNIVSGKFWYYIIEEGGTPSGDPLYLSDPFELHPGEDRNDYRTENVSNLEEGDYELITRVGTNYPIFDDEDVDSFIIMREIAKKAVPVNINGPEPEYTSIYYQAENASQLVAPMQISKNGNFIGAEWNDDTTSCGGTNGPQDSCGYAQYEVTIPQGKGGQYLILGEVFATAGDRDSFWVEFDGIGAVLWDTLQGIYTNQEDPWDWDLVTHRGGGNYQNPEDNPHYFSLSQGAHTLKIYVRDDGTGLNSFLITDNPAVLEYDEGRQYLGDI